MILEFDCDGESRSLFWGDGGEIKDQDHGIGCF